MNSTVKYVIKTVFKAISLIIAISILTFVLAELSPIDPVKAYVGAESTVSQEQKDLIAERWGLDESPVSRFFKWGNAILHLDFGTSQIYGVPVLTVIKKGAANSFALMSVSWLLSGIIGFFAGLLAAAYRDRLLDRIIRTFCYILSSTPTFWVGILLLLIFSVQLKIFPIGMSAPIGVLASDVTIWDRIHHMILPALTLSILGVAQLAMFTREEMIKVFNSEYALFAHAKGLKTGEIIKKHGIRNVLIPAVTIQFASLSELFGGSVLAENVFSYAGLGSVTVEAGTKVDLPLLLGITIITSMVVFTGNMIANLLYPVIDPRIKEGQYGK